VCEPSGNLLARSLRPPTSRTVYMTSNTVHARPAASRCAATEPAPCQAAGPPPCSAENRVYHRVRQGLRLRQGGEVGDDVLQLRGAAHGHDHLAPPCVRGHEEGRLVVRPCGRQLDIVEREACAPRRAPVRPGAPGQCLSCSTPAAPPCGAALSRAAEPLLRAAAERRSGQSPVAARPLQGQTSSTRACACRAHSVSTPRHTVLSPALLKAPQCARSPLAEPSTQLGSPANASEGRKRSAACRARALALQAPRQLRLGRALVALVGQVQVVRELVQQVVRDRRRAAAGAQVRRGRLARALGEQVDQPRGQLGERQRLQLFQLRELVVHPVGGRDGAPRMSRGRVELG